MKLEFIINEAVSLREFIHSLDISDKLLADIKNNGDLRVNHQHVTIRYLLNVSDYLEIIFPEEKRGKQLQANKMPLDIIYEDDYLLVINKPPLIACIPDHRYHDHTLANGIIAYYETIGLASTVHFVNRLDRETSGLLIVAKYRYLHHLFSKCLVKRKYLALTSRIIENQTINLPIGRLGNHVRRVISDEGKISITHCSVVQNKPEGCLIECQLETGRTHQIRVHLAAIGAPLIGDSLYEGKSNQAGTYYLHSYSLDFVHPITKASLHFKSERPITNEYFKTANE